MGTCSVPSIHSRVITHVFAASDPESGCDAENAVTKASQVHGRAQLGRQQRDCGDAQRLTAQQQEEVQKPVGGLDADDQVGPDAGGGQGIHDPHDVAGKIAVGNAGLSIGDGSGIRPLVCMRM